jgi:hypothetical protein
MYQCSNTYIYIKIPPVLSACLYSVTGSAYLFLSEAGYMQVQADLSDSFGLYLEAV